MRHVKQFPDPPHAYVPGQTQRHPPEQFHQIGATAHPGLSIAQLLHSDAWAAGLQFLNTGYFWEAHEVFEPVWLALPAQTPERDLARALIQLANAQLKQKMQRPNAVLRLCDQVEQLIRDLPSGICRQSGYPRAALRKTLATLRNDANRECAL